MMSEQRVSKLRGHGRKLGWGNIYVYLRLHEVSFLWIVSLEGSGS